MGTTSTALRTQTGVTYCYVLAIEGYTNLLTDHVSTSAVVTAWAASEWDACLPGLKVGGPLGQKFKPWQTGLDIQTLQVSVMPDETDAFGQAVFKAKATYNTRLTSTFRPDDTGAGTIDVKSTAGFGASGDVYIGGQKHSYSSKGAGTFTIGAAGANTHSPFGAYSGNHLSGPATMPDNVNWSTSVAPRVASAPTAWIGRKVALYIHRLRDGVLDTLAQAQLEFAGLIRDITDSEDGTVLEFEDIRAKISDCVILQDQWVGYVKHGIKLKAGMRLFASEINGGTSDDFVVMSSGASGPNQIDSGYYDVEAFRSALNTWLANEKDASRLDMTWAIAKETTDEGGTRIVVRTTFPGATLTDYRAPRLHCSSHYILNFLGFTELKQMKNQDAYWLYIEGAPVNNSVEELIVVGSRAPYKAKFLQNNDFRQGVDQNVTVHLDTSDGRFFDQRDYLPTGLVQYTTAGDAWGIFLVGNAVYMAQVDSASTPTILSDLTKWTGPLRYIDERDDVDNDGLTVDDEADLLPVKQILLLSGAFADIMTKLIASIPDGEGGVNHPDYDVFPWGAGVPWSLLGDNWLNSCASLAGAQNSKSLTMLVTEPTQLLDLLLPELTLRFAWIAWKDEGLQLRTLPTPNATTADHTLNEANKAEPAGVSASGRTTTNITNEYLRNIIKLDYARNAAGKYRRHLRVVDQASVTEYGGTAVKTIEAINSFGNEQQVSASVEELAASLVSRVFPKFAKPLWVMRRSIAPTLYHAVPGDTVTVSDGFARDPTTGVRGVSNRAGVVLSVSYDRGSEGGKLFGEVEILLSGEDRHYPMAPAAEVDTSYNGAIDAHTFVNGYDAATGALKLKDHAYSTSAAALDVTHLAATDLIRIVRLETSDAWSRTIGTVDAVDGYIVPTATLSSPAWTSSTAARYRIQYREYSACTASQKLHSFQADDADGYIEDAAEPNSYGEQDWQAFGSATLTDLPVLPVAAEYWGDGKPFHSGLLRDISLFNNNLPSYRTAPNSPLLVNVPSTISVPSIFVLSFFAPFHVGPQPTSGSVRKLYIAPLFMSSDAGNTATVRVTSSEQPPKAGLGAPDFQGITRSVSFTTTSTSLVEATAQSLLPVRSNGGSLTWLTVEIKASALTETTTCYGLSRLYLGPVEAA